MSREHPISRHMPAIAKLYMTEDPTIPFDEYVDTICCYCLDEQHLVSFLASGMTLGQLIEKSPVSLRFAWQKADETARKAIVLEAKLLLVQAKAGKGPESYAEACERVAHMVGVGRGSGKGTAKRRARLVGSLFASTQKELRGSFIKEIAAAYGQAVLPELADCYTIIENAPVMPEQLSREAGIS